MESQPLDDQRRMSHGVAVGLVVLAVLTFYILSVGPAVRYYNASPEWAKKGIEALYFPLEVLDRNTPGRPIDRYVDLWR